MYYVDKVALGLGSENMAFCVDDPVADEEYTRIYLQKRKEYKERNKIDPLRFKNGR